MADSPSIEGTGRAIVASWRVRAAVAVLSSDPHRRIRIAQWLISALVYTACILVFCIGIWQGWLHAGSVIAWCEFIMATQAAVYVALRTGWSERFKDPALTTAQIVLGVIGVEWGYCIFGPVRSVALFPLMLIFTFGAFSLSWNRIMWLTLFALVSLLATVAVLHVEQFRVYGWALDNKDLRLDFSNVLMIMILLPALSLISARLSSLRYKLRMQRAALTEALEEVQRLATHDELTGLANRRYMLERLAQELHRYQRQGHPFCIAIIDLDRFKQINDELGHAFGDLVLKSFATLATDTLRTSDMTARWGGEEFLLLLPDTRGPEAAVSVRRLLSRMDSLPHGTCPTLTFSAGIAEYLRDESIADTIARADSAMYKAKESGRNAVMLHPSAEDQQGVAMSAPATAISAPQDP